MRIDRQSDVFTESSYKFFPYGAQKYLAGFFLITAIVFFLCALQVWTTLWIKIILVSFGILVLYMAKKMECQSRLHVAIDSKEIMLRNCVTKDLFKMKLEEFFCAYIIYDGKGHSYILFLVSPMEENERKHLVSKFFVCKAGNPPLSINRNVCIRVDRHKDAIISIVDKRIPIIDVKYGMYGI